MLQSRYNHNRSKSIQRDNYSYHNSKGRDQLNNREYHNHKNHHNLNHHRDQTRNYQDEQRRHQKQYKHQYQSQERRNGGPVQNRQQERKSYYREEPDMKKVYRGDNFKPTPPKREQYPSPPEIQSYMNIFELLENHSNIPADDKEDKGKQQSIAYPIEKKSMVYKPPQSKKKVPSPASTASQTDPNGSASQKENIELRSSEKVRKTVEEAKSKKKIPAKQKKSTKANTACDNGKANTINPKENEPKGTNKKKEEGKGKTDLKKSQKRAMAQDTSQPERKEKSSKKDTLTSQKQRHAQQKVKPQPIKLPGGLRMDELLRGVITRDAKRPEFLERKELCINYATQQKKEIKRAVGRDIEEAIFFMRKKKEELKKKKLKWFEQRNSPILKEVRDFLFGIHQHKKKEAFQAEVMKFGEASVFLSLNYETKKFNFYLV